MIVVGLTGGIGSGKTTVARMFHELGIPVYIADDEAKKLMVRSKVIRRKLIQLFGEKAYTDKGLNRSHIAKKIFNNKVLLAQMNAIVHPRVQAHFRRWLLKQDAPYVIKEAAILFENDGYKQCDLMISVVVPEDIRIDRVLKRDKTTVKRIKAIIGNQWKDSQRIDLSDFVIHNCDIDQTTKDVENIHQSILKSIQ